MAARSLFHCAASWAIPLPLRSQKAHDHENLLRSPSGTGVHEHKISNTGKTSENGLRSDCILETQGLSQAEESEILSWLESFEMQDWISCVGGTSQDAMTSHIIVAAALAIWYPSLVKPCLTTLVVHPLMKLVMALNDKYSSTAAELLAEGMESTWKACIPAEIPRLIGDIFFQIEFVSGAPTDSSAQNPAIPPNIRGNLVGILLPSLATADILGILNAIESQIWSTASDSPVHVVSLMTLIRVIRGSPRNLAQYLDKVVNFILQTMDPSNSVLRKTCFQSSVAALKEVVRIFPMVALNETSTRLAVGDAIGEINNASIRVYDMQGVTKVKVLDANEPPGLPSLLGGVSEVVTAISALSFSSDGEGLLAFSEHGLMIRWWSLGSAWWEKLSRNLVPVQCTKLIFVPPWEGFSPNSTRSSIMEMDHDRQANAKIGIARNGKLHSLQFAYCIFESAKFISTLALILMQKAPSLGLARVPCSQLLLIP
ncbi:WD repeat-containing protein [Actinidia chinensis var. chinensis]|uniref:WD repeat-containing protein n=1 Tax=Actinidia chinensis var. chinensis TaxID=1590841 RepID=A0A2R6QJ54_ACTCC|nr:WD repeat-containing protein [Actinidia chinensis var. chinensis]